MLAVDGSRPVRNPGRPDCLIGSFGNTSLAPTPIRNGSLSCIAIIDTLGGEPGIANTPCSSYTDTADTRFQIARLCPGGEQEMNGLVATLAVALFMAGPALAQSLPPGLVGRWDVSQEACAASGTSVSQIDILPDRIDTFGGNAILREVEKIGDVTFVAGDFEQREGAEQIAPRTGEYFRFDQRDGPDRMTFVWKDVQRTALVRCGKAVVEKKAVDLAPRPPAANEPGYDGQLPIPLGLWVIAGESCQNPANAGWRVYDGAGLRGASSIRCEIDATQRQGESILFSQLCEASYDGKVRATRDRITITAPRRFTLLEAAGESPDEDAGRSGQDFNWCGPQLRP
jgi:hypothetical protein